MPQRVPGDRAVGAAVGLCAACEVVGAAADGRLPHVVDVASRDAEAAAVEEVDAVLLVFLRQRPAGDGGVAGLPRGDVGAVRGVGAVSVGERPGGEAVGVGEVRREGDHVVRGTGTRRDALDRKLLVLPVRLATTGDGETSVEVQPLADHVGRGRSVGDLDGRLAGCGVRGERREGEERVAAAVDGQAFDGEVRAVRHGQDVRRAAVRRPDHVRREGEDRAALTSHGEVGQALDEDARGDVCALRQVEGAARWQCGDRGGNGRCVVDGSVTDGAVVADVRDRVRGLGELAVGVGLRRGEGCARGACLVERGDGHR